MKKNTKKGFTLVELLVVIAILAILASVAVVGYTAFIKKADDQAAATEIDQIEALLDAALLTDGKVEIEKTVGDVTSYILITKATTAGVSTITVETKNTSTDGATDLTTELGTLVSKLSFNENKLVYNYKAGSDAVVILP